MPQFDPEEFRDYFLALVQDNLGAKVTEINTEKGDALITDLTDDQYISSFNDKVMNEESFCYHRIMDIVTEESHAGGVSLRITMMFVFLFTEQQDWGIAEKKILRYTRAVQEIFSENARKESRISDLTIEPFAPDMIALSENSPYMQAGGVQVSGVITT